MQVKVVLGIMRMEKQSHFGFKHVPHHEKKTLVNEVFSAVSTQYDFMNDLMSLGMHRLWKDYFVNKLNIQPESQLLDLACGTGDIARRISKKLSKKGNIVIADYNLPMLSQGHDNLLDHGVINHPCNVDGHQLPFKTNTFDHVVISFGLRNMDDHNRVLKSCLNVLKPGGQLSVLEFSHPENDILNQIYDWYSFNIIPQLGHWVAQSKSSYQYLVESIRMHPKAPELLLTFERNGFQHCQFEYLTGGIVAIHQGKKP